MSERVAIAPVRKTVHLKAPIGHAFEVFTSGLTRWWPHDHGVNLVTWLANMQARPSMQATTWERLAEMERERPGGSLTPDGRADARASAR